MQNLIQNIVEQADFYLKQAGEFYPFASVVTAHSEIRPLGILMEDLRPKPDRVLAELEKAALEGMRRGDYSAYAIGINVNLERETRGDSGFFNPGEGSALEIRLRESADRPYRVMALPYSLDEITKEVVFEEFLRIRQE